MFSGSVRITLCEAADLRPTAYQERVYLGGLGSTDQTIDPYVTIDLDEVNFHKYNLLLQLLSYVLVSMHLSILISRLNVKLPFVG